MRLAGYKNIKGVITVVTGLHIGGSTTIIEIGGKDNPAIKQPLTKEPYIPGSSLKGKMRSLLEWNMGKINMESGKNYGEVHKCKDKTCPICVIFGTSADEADLGPTRLIVRDAFISKEYKQSQRDKNIAWTVLDITEDKYENSINRITARANPRNFERVIAGTEFSFEMSYRVFENSSGANQDEGFFKHVIEGLKLIERDALGGAGSRGCGQVSFKIEVDGAYKDLKDVTVADFPTDRVEAEHVES
ncbi:MAG: type III-A CRISPR-associated RAMP protein Csm3 [Nitrospirae bacterium]|nr:type III-A CRISPR-associated RAMP protein Csm3 [Nitrospirota bacterium]